MTSRKKEKKEIKRLRRQLEALKAELKAQKRSAKVVSHRPSPESDSFQKIYKEREYDIGPDLRKTVLITTLTFFILIAAFLTQNRWFSFIF